LLGFVFEKPVLDELYKRFLDVADIKKEVNDKDLVELAREAVVA
jgi:2-isopropylmalate synthase